MPPEVRARLNRSPLARWPLSQSRRDGAVVVVAERMAGLRGALPRGHIVIPEPEASRVAAAVEAEGFAAASAYAAGKSLDTDEERSDVFWRYVKEVWSIAYRYNRSRIQATGTARKAGPACQPPPAASSVVVAVVSGPMQQLQLGLPSPFAPLPPAAPEE